MWIVLRKDIPLASEVARVGRAAGEPKTKGDKSAGFVWQCKTNQNTEMTWIILSVSAYRENDNIGRV